LAKAILFQPFNPIAHGLVQVTTLGWGPLSGLRVSPPWTASYGRGSACGTPGRRSSSGRGRTATNPKLLSSKKVNRRREKKEVGTKKGKNYEIKLLEVIISDMKRRRECLNLKKGRDEKVCIVSQN